MNFRYLLFSGLFSFVFLYPVTAQEVGHLPGPVNKALQQWGEVVFRFKIDNHAQLSELTSIISIDKVWGDSVMAYANAGEMKAFISKNIDYQLIPHPTIENPPMLSVVPESLPITWDYYPNYSAYETLMNQFQVNYPSLCHIDTLTTLPSGRRLLVAKISDNVNTRENEPQFLYTSSMHGNELTGYVTMLRLIDYLLTNYGTNTRVTSMVNNMEIWICPLANPDGTFHGGNNSVGGAIRYNNNYVD
ncbi:MAG: M14 family zinc carboxypeptidase, partial [Bacteroidetes bacterium]|nr:M14 family zinc carboxypeptidase [Bacteroidota bacterium]